MTNCKIHNVEFVEVFPDRSPGGRHYECPECRAISCPICHEPMQPELKMCRPCRTAGELWAARQARQARLNDWCDTSEIKLRTLFGRDGEGEPDPLLIQAREGERLLIFAGPPPCQGVEMRKDEIRELVGELLALLEEFS